VRFGIRSVCRPADQRANPRTHCRSSNIDGGPLLHLVAIDDDRMNEQGSVDARADAGAYRARQRPGRAIAAPFRAESRGLWLPETRLCLLKSPFLLRPLMLHLPIDTLPGSHVGAPVDSVDPANMGAFARRASTRNPGVAAPNAGAAARPPAEATARQGGPLALGRPVACLDRMANGAPDRQA